MCYKKFKGKFLSGYYKLPEYVVIQCKRFIKGLSMHIYNISFKSGIFLEKFKTVRVKSLYKKRDFLNVQNNSYQFFSVFSKIMEKLMYVYNQVKMFLNNIIFSQRLKMDLGKTVYQYSN
jgi:hypothetical protein